MAEYRYAVQAAFSNAQAPWPHQQKYLHIPAIVQGLDLLNPAE